MGENARTAFVLAGGGSFGAVEVGMLKALVSHGVRPDLVIGSSVGAINGAYFVAEPNATGIERLEQIWRGLRRDQVFPFALRNLFGMLFRRDYLVDSAGLRRLLEQHLPFQRLEEASLPFYVIATDLVAGTEVRLSSGPAVEAVLASAAVPGVFPPVRIGGRFLVDGSIASNTPIPAAVALGAKRVIVLPTGFACSLETPPRGAVATVLHCLNLLIAHQLALDIERLAGAARLVVVPPLCPLAISPYDFSHCGDLIDRAAETTRHWLERGGLEGGGVPGALIPHTH